MWWIVLLSARMVSHSQHYISTQHKGLFLSVFHVSKIRWENMNISTLELQLLKTVTLLSVILPAVYPAVLFTHYCNLKSLSVHFYHFPCPWEASQLALTPFPVSPVHLHALTSYPHFPIAVVQQTHKESDTPNCWPQSFQLHLLGGPLNAWVHDMRPRTRKSFQVLLQKLL